MAATFTQFRCRSHKVNLEWYRLPEKMNVKGDDFAVNNGGGHGRISKGLDGSDLKISDVARNFLVQQDKGEKAAKIELKFGYHDIKELNFESFHDMDEVIPDGRSCQLPVLQQRHVAGVGPHGDHGQHAEEVEPALI